MLAAIKKPDASTEYDVWEVVEDEAFIARYSGEDIVVGLSRDDLKEKLRERYPAEEHYQRVFAAGYNEGRFECLAQGQLQNSPEALETARDKARRGEVIDLGAAGYEVYSRLDSVHGDGNVTAVFDGFVLDHSNGQYLLRYNPEENQRIRLAAAKREREKRKRTGRRSNTCITDSVRRGQIGCWTLGEFLDTLRYRIVEQKPCQGVFGYSSRAWYYGAKPVRLSRVRILFGLLSLLEALAGKRFVYRARSENQYRSQALPRLLDEAEAALPALKKAIKDFDHNWKRFSFVTGAKFDDTNRKEALEARKLMSKFARWLDDELKHSVRGDRRRSRVQVQRRGQRRV